MPLTLTLPRCVQVIVPHSPTLLPHALMVKDSAPKPEHLEGQEQDSAAMRFRRRFRRRRAKRKSAPSVDPVLRAVPPPMGHGFNWQSLLTKSYRAPVLLVRITAQLPRRLSFTRIVTLVNKCHGIEIKYHLVFNASQNAFWGSKFVFRILGSSQMPIWDGRLCCYSQNQWIFEI